MAKGLVILLFPLISFAQEPSSWIRINQLGYTPQGIKVAVFCSKSGTPGDKWQLIETVSKKTVASGNTGKGFGAYGPFTHTYRLNFTSFKKPGRYYLQAGSASSPEFTIGEDVYKGAADFCLRYMRQQRSGFNPFLNDSCHTNDGYVLYGEKAGIKDSTHIQVSGGWHDASDYLQYSTTSANATCHLLMAYRDFPAVFHDVKLANGLDGKNGYADVLDEARWGLDWLLKMHPADGWMFNQIADDRDHMGMRIPKQDSFYGRGNERPVYFLSGEPQQRGKFMNSSTGTASTAGKFSSAFALGSMVYNREFYKNPNKNKTAQKMADSLRLKSYSAFAFGFKKPGISQTASVRSPYIYEESNWVDDMELAAVLVNNATDPHNRNEWYLDYADSLARLEPLTPWLGTDTAKHYQWYPFINLGHYELAKKLKGKTRNTIIGYYRQGIRAVWNKAKQNAFYRGIPFIWCSNNLATSFAIQCYWYKQLTGDNTFNELEQANIDWLFGCNPWGTSMVYGLPHNGDTPDDPHSAFTHLKNYPIDGGLVDGPVYGSIYRNLIGITLYQPDEYAAFQSNLAVYHDDYGDYSTNEPTMDGTASLVYLLAAKENETAAPVNFTYHRGGIIRGDTTEKNIAIVFTGDEFTDGVPIITRTLEKEKIRASFFFTRRPFEDPDNETWIKRLIKGGHFLGNHSFEHRLCCDWTKRDSLLLTKNEFVSDLLGLDPVLDKLGIAASANKYFLPPYEWYNDSISIWTNEYGRRVVNFTPGTLSTADYTTPGMKNYRSSEVIYNSIIEYEQKAGSALNGFILLLHVGTDPERTDKFYNRLPELIRYLKRKGYSFKTIEELLKTP
jgi:peptidoglycan/xylan/chitin deacetylase (PgdA/CDA1 family)